MNQAEELIEIVYSSYNGNLKVIKDEYGYNIISNKIIQSGLVIRKIWESVLIKIKNRAPEIKQALILGLGAGSVLQVLLELWPNILISGIEIDPVMINLGKKYYKLDTLLNLKIINTSAFEWIGNPGSNIFDIVLVDLFLKRNPRKILLESRFIERINNITTGKGIIIFNFLYHTKKDKKYVNGFSTKIKKIFPKIQPSRAESNYMFMCFK